MLAAAAGGHISTGIGEKPMLDGKRGGSAYTNVYQVEMAVELAHLAGREVASPAEAPRILGMPPREVGRLVG